VVSCPSGVAMFRVGTTLDEPAGPPTYQWRKDGVAINTIANPSAATATLALSDVQDADLGSYTCAVNYPCGGAGALSDAATLSFVADQCGSADFDGDGDAGTDLDIETFFRVLGGGSC